MVDKAGLRCGRKVVILVEDVVVYPCTHKTVLVIVFYIMMLKIKTKQKFIGLCLDKI